MSRNSAPEMRDLLERLIELSPDHNATSLGLKIGDKGYVSDFLGGRKKSLRGDAILTIEAELGLPLGYLVGAASDIPPEEAIGRFNNKKLIENAKRKALANDDPYALPLFVRPIPKRENPNRPVPVYASAEGGDGAMIVDSEPVSWEPRPNLIGDENDLYGVVIEGTSMAKAYVPGDTAWMHPRYRERRDMACIFRSYNETTGEAKATIKWLNDFTTEAWKVEQLNPPKHFELSRKEWPECFRVLGKKNAGA